MPILKAATVEENHKGLIALGLLSLIVRAPITGIILATEMTGSFTLLLPMLTSCFAAMIVPTVLHCPPIYDSLRDRMLKTKGDPAH